MHTREQASELWCPMVRTIRVGAAPYQDAYNRVVTMESHKIMGRPQADGELDLGEPIPISVLGGEVDFSPESSRCIADKCAMWRWSPDDRTHGYCGLAGRPEVQP